MTTKRDMVKMCRKRNWAGYTKYPSKQELSVFVAMNYRREIRAARCIQAWWRQVAKCRQECVQVNDVDVITSEPLGEIDSFELFDMANKKKFVFSSRSLMECTLASGKFENPYTRKPLGIREKKQLFYHYLTNHGQDPVTYELKKQTYVLDSNAKDRFLKIFDVVELERKKERHQQYHVELASDECLQWIERIITMVDTIPSMDQETIHSVMVHVGSYYIIELLVPFLEVCQLDQGSGIELASRCTCRLAAYRESIPPTYDASVVKRIIVTTAVSDLRCQFHKVLQNSSPRVIPLILY